MMRWLLRKAALAALWLVFVATLAEVTGWVYFKLEVSKPIGGYGYPKEMFIPLEQVEYGYRPNFKGTFAGVGFFTIPIEINANGFRDGPVAAKAPGALRIAVQGDSVVMGAGVAAADRFTDLLHGLKLPGGKSAEILNLGVNSYAFVHYLGQVRRNFEGLQPDAVVIGFTLNDYQDFSSAWPRKVVLADNAPGPNPTLETRIRRDLANSYAGRFLTDLRDKARLALLESDEAEAYHTKWMRRAIEEWSRTAVVERMRARLAEMKGLLAQRHLPALVLVFPELNDVEHPEKFGLARETVLKLLKEQGLPACDPYPAFAKAAHPETLFLPHDSVHFTPAGHRVLADTLAACLRDAGWGR